MKFISILVVVIGIIYIPIASYAFDKPIYMLHYTGLDTIPVVYGSCIPLTVYDEYPASIVVMPLDSYCTSYSDQACQTSSTSKISVKSGLTGLDELGKEFSKDKFMVCTLISHDDQETTTS